MTVLALIGPTGLYLLFSWLIGAAASGWVSERKGYGERVGLTFGLLLWVPGFLFVAIVLPGRPGARWEGWLPWTRRATAEPRLEDSRPTGSPQ